MIMQMVRATSRAVLTGSLAGLMACAQGPKDKADAAADLDYRRADVTLMGGDLVRVQLAIKGATEQEQLDSYARCVVAGYAVKNNAGFARHVRTITDKEGGIWHADAVYSVTAALPEGLVTIDAELTAEDCESQGIPTGPKA